jgi:hypothetical protein
MTKEISVRYDTTFETPESFAEECKDELEGEIGLILDSTRVENLAKIVYDAIQPHTTPAIPNARTDVAGDDRPSVSALPPTLVLPLPPERPVSPISPQVSPSRRASTETTEPVPTVSRTASLELASANSEQDKRSASAPNTKPDQALTGQSHFQEHHSQPPQVRKWALRAMLVHNMVAAIACRNTVAHPSALWKWFTARRHYRDSHLLFADAQHAIP